MRPRLLDLFCKAGGASMGYHRAGFDVVGVDIEPQPRYPFEFIQADALEVLADETFLTAFDALAASPPCQKYTPLAHLTGKDYPDLVGPVRDRFRAAGIPYAIENVPGAPMPGALVLCGTEFGLKAECRDGQVRWLRRHRLFETSLLVMGAGGCYCGHLPIGGVYGTGGGGQMNHGYKFHPAEARDAMGIDWMTRAELSQAIPPAYTQYIGVAIIEHLVVAA